MRLRQGPCGYRIPLLMFAWMVLCLAACSPNGDFVAPVPGTVFVSIQDDFFQPETVTVARGKPVRWTNQGRLVHSVASTAASFTSDLIAPTFWFEIAFDSAGTFEYSCAQHDDIKTGVVIVQ